MHCIREQKYQWGQPVVALTDLINDGSYPGAELDSLLIESGTQGEIVQAGLQEESDTPMYLVKFPGGKVVGCLEPEIAPAKNISLQLS
jgi:nitrogen fixation protein NifZ